MDPWYSFGSHDMLDVAHMDLHVGQMTAVKEIQQTCAVVTGPNPAEAIRLRATRLYVLRRGKVAASTPAVQGERTLDGKIAYVDWMQ